MVTRRHHLHSYHWQAAFRNQRCQDDLQKNQNEQLFIPRDRPDLRLSPRPNYQNPEQRPKQAAHSGRHPDAPVAQQRGLNPTHAAPLHAGLPSVAHLHPAVPECKWRGQGLQ